MAANLYKRLNPRISVTALAEAFNKNHCNISYWSKNHDYEMETEPDYVIDYTACCNALGLSVNDDDRTDTALVISELNAKIHKLTAENYKLKSSVSMIIRCTDEVSNVINAI
jgi:tRNA A37 threonylcarbamoyladenosine dehydratase